MFVMPGGKALSPWRVTGGVRVWTPVDVSGAGLTFSSVSAYYGRSGKLVTASFILVYPATADGTNAAVGGFPFTAGYAIALAPVGTSTTAATIFRLGNGSRQGNFFNNTFTPATNVALTGAVIRCTVNYLTV